MTSIITTRSAHKKTTRKKQQQQIKKLKQKFHGKDSNHTNSLFHNYKSDEIFLKWD